MDVSENNIKRILLEGIRSRRLTKPLSHLAKSSKNNDISIDDVLTNTAHAIAKNIVNVNLVSLRRDPRLYNGKEYFQLLFIDKATAYVLSKLLTEELREAFNLDFPGRDCLLERLKISFSVDHPTAIIRSDIKSFFEGINHRRLLEKLKANPRVSQLAIEYYTKIFNEYERYKPEIYQTGYGVPRGLAVSSYLAEVYLKDIDSEIRKLPGVLLYERYVDDFVILIKLNNEEDASEYYRKLEEIFKGSDLFLHTADDSKSTVRNLKGRGTEIDLGSYLGYNLSYNPVSNSLEFRMSQKKIDRKKTMIDKAFLHFEKLSRFDVRKARRDLIDCLNVLSANYNLFGCKEDIRTGIYYSNRQLTNLSDLDNLTDYLHSKPILPYAKSFSSTYDLIKFSDKLKLRIYTIDFRKNWESRKMLSFERLRFTLLKSFINTNTTSNSEVKAFDYTTH